MYKYCYVGVVHLIYSVSYNLSLTSTIKKCFTVIAPLTVGKSLNLPKWGLHECSLLVPVHFLIPVMNFCSIHIFLLLMLSLSNIQITNLEKKNLRNLTYLLITRRRYVKYLYKIIVIIGYTKEKVKLNYGNFQLAWIEIQSCHNFC